MVLLWVLQIEKIRKEEMQVTRRKTLMMSMSHTLNHMIPVLATATSVIGYM